MNLKPFAIALITALIVNIIYNGVYITMFKDGANSKKKDRLMFHFQQIHFTSTLTSTGAAAESSVVSDHGESNNNQDIYDAIGVSKDKEKVLLRKRVGVVDNDEVMVLKIDISEKGKKLNDGLMNEQDKVEANNEDNRAAIIDNAKDQRINHSEKKKENGNSEKLMTINENIERKDEEMNSIDHMIRKRRKDGREYFVHKELIKHEKLGIEYSQGLNTKEIGPICSDKVGMKKYRCDSPNEYCDQPVCTHSSVYQAVPGKSIVSQNDFTRFFEHRSHYFQSMEERLEHVSQLLDAYHKELGIKKFSRPMFLMFINFGYIYQFFNWLCSCEKNGIENIRRDVIVLTTDDMAESVLRSVGIFTINVADSGAWMRNTKYEAHASKKFGLGVHAKINTQSIALLTDMIQLGYDVFVMDADLVWKKDPRPEMIKLAEENDYDGLFISDGRKWEYSYEFGKILEQFRDTSDFDHPYMTHNTGFFLIRSSPSMKEFTASLMQGVHLILWKGTDQMWWNTLIFHKKFSHLKFGVMPTKTYIPGSNISTSGVLKNPREPFPKDDYVVAHMSDTNSHLKKVTKFYLTGQWYLTEECPLYQTCLATKIAGESAMGCLPDNYKDYFDKDMVVPAGR